MCDSGGDSASECSGISPADEDRVKRLFLACDYNGDGFIDSSDLEMVCQELDLGSCVQELLVELGADQSGRVSYKDFLCRRKALRGEIAAFKEGICSGGESSQDLHNTSTSGNSLKKQEKWEWDSGARDLESPEMSETPPPAPPDAMAELASTGVTVLGEERGEGVGGGASSAVYYYGDLEHRKPRPEPAPTHVHGRGSHLHHNHNNSNNSNTVAIGKKNVQGQGAGSDQDTEETAAEERPLLATVTGIHGCGLECPVPLADRSRAYLGKNLDLEVEGVDRRISVDDQLERLYDCPRRSLTYSTAGTFPLPDKSADRVAPVIVETQPLTRSRSWYLCCPGAQAPLPADGAPIQAPPPLPLYQDTAFAIDNSYLHLAAVSSLKNEVLELSARLHAAHRQRDIAKEALSVSQNECDRLRNQVSTCEERLTELHGVIAELRRSNAARDRNAIPELGEEESELETSYRENSEASENGGSEHTTSAADLDQTESPKQTRSVSGATSPAALPIPGQMPMSPDQEHGKRGSPLDGYMEQHLAGYVADSTSMEDEILEVDKRKYTNERSRRKPSARSPRNTDRGRNSADIPDRPPPIHYSPRLQSRSDGVRGSPQMKVASRVRLRKTNEDTRLTGQDICQEGVFTSAVAEHLARSSLRRHDDFYDEEGRHGENHGEEERLVARMDRLEADNALLSATLRESKQHADRLSLACAQCSAEAGALRIALAAADRAVEAYDVLLALAETNQTEEGAQMRNATERVARQLLSKLDAEATGLHQIEAGPGPWADAASMLVYNTDSSEDGWSNEDEQRLRNHVSRLKRERSVAASSAQPAPWPLQDDNDGTDEGISSSRNSEKLRSLEPADTRRMDMETAVLMQEVMSLREERAELRARLRAARHCTGGAATNTMSSVEDGECERRLLEALARENTLKTRLQRLMTTIHQTGRMTEHEDLKKHGCQRCVSVNKNVDSGKEASDDTGNPDTVITDTIVQ